MFFLRNCVVVFFIFLSQVLFASEKGPDCSRRSLTPEEIAECDRLSDREKIVFPQMPTLEERKKLIEKTKPQRDRYTRIRATIQNMYESMLLSAAIYDTQSAQNVIWESLYKTLKSNVFEQDYKIEVHYIHLDDLKKRDIDPVVVASDYKLKHENNQRIISVVTFKPKSVDKPTPLTIYSHGGQPNNHFQPTQMPPMFYAFAGLGYTIACLNYRGESPENHEEDMKAVVSHFRGLGEIDPNKIVLSGISAGTTLNAQILDKPIMNEFSGIFLHTGLYGHKGIFDALLGIPKKLSVFLASGRLDELISLETTLKYVRALQDISDNFQYFILDKGGHQLINSLKPNPEIPSIASQSDFSPEEIT